MFHLKKTDRQIPGLEDELTRIVTILNKYSPEDPEYKQITAQLKKLHALKTEDKSERLSPNTVAMVLANLAGIAMIVEYERMNVIASKGLGLLMKAVR